MKSVFIFIPDGFNYNESKTLRGFVKNLKDSLSFYILTNTSDRIGICKDDFLHIKEPQQSTQFRIHYKTGQILVNGVECDDKVTFIMYDYSAFRECDISTYNCNDYGEHFSTLIRAVQNEKRAPSLNGHTLYFIIIKFFLRFLVIVNKILKRPPSLLRHSETAIHMHQTVHTMQWALKLLRRQQRITLRIGNVFMSKFADFLCGLLALYLIMQHETVLIHYAKFITETIIQALEHLLQFLMGSPAGLKLNSTFNLTLGTFFSYHVTLWRAFLHVTGPLLRFVLYLAVFPGACGLSFQTAVLSDLVALGSFHIYCIYVYAARLYGVQMKGLISLWRLFIGRKYNPLRKRVDSHQYTHNQLFVGTLVFTVLLFLFPTTFLYYSVFVTLRIFLIVLNGLLLRLRYYLQLFPIYTIILWLKNSPSVRGAIKLSPIRNSSNENCKIYVSLFTLPFWKNMQSTVPETLPSIRPISWKTVFKDILMGSLL